jgi:virulence factor Mce-like protein
MGAVSERLDRVLSRAPVALGVTTVVTTLALMVLNFQGLLNGIFSSHETRTVSAVFSDTQQLRTGNDVRIDGVTIGKIDAIQRDRGGRSATVRMTIDKDSGPLYANAGATLRWRTVLGAAFYVQLQRGSPASGTLRSATIAVNHTTNQVEIDDISSIFRHNAVHGLQTLPAETARALGDEQAPRRALQAVDKISPSLAQGVGALRGQRVDHDLRQLVSTAAATVRAVDTPDDKVRTAVAGAAATLHVTAQRQGDLRSTVGRAPAVLARTDATVRALNVTLRKADPLVAELRPSAAKVAPTLSQLRPTVVSADALLRRAVPLLRTLRPALSSLSQASQITLPLLDNLTPSLTRLDKSILPYLDAVDPETQHSTSEMIGPTFTGLGSGAGGQEDVNGHFIRFPATSGNSAVYLPCQIYFSNPDKSQILACKSLQDALKSYLNYNPLGPAPGTAPATRAKR